MDIEKAKIINPLGAKIRWFETYVTFQGEVNVAGIGAPAIFVRLAGCHLRCYLKTLGTLCDTPQALEKNSGKELSPHELYQAILKTSCDSGIKLVCLTGGDPLFQNQEALRELLYWLADGDFTVSVETSGTIDWSPFRHLLNTHWVLDYKLKSCGLKPLADGEERNLLAYLENLTLLDGRDFIKFVIYDMEDFNEAETAAKKIVSFYKSPHGEKQMTKKVIPYADFAPKIAFGNFWGGKLSPFEIFNLCKERGLLGEVVMNFQVHKMALASDYSVNLDKLQI